MLNAQNDCLKDWGACILVFHMKEVCIMKKKVFKSFPVPKVSVSGKYEAIFEVETESGELTEVMDTIWIFKDGVNSRINQKIVRLVRLVEEHKPLKASEMDLDGVVKLNEALIMDARSVVDFFNKTIERHDKWIEDANAERLVWYYENLFSEDWGLEMAEALQKDYQGAVDAKAEYISRAESSYKYAVAFLRMMYDEISGEELPDSLLRRD